jgi:hypothetical protein
MLSSVIPARLEFGCGHVALVSLPRLKGESAAKRTERVNSEKVGARGRSCDFCGPRADALVQVRAAPDAVASLGDRNGHVPSPAPRPPTASVVAPAPVVTPAPPVTAPAAVAASASRRRRAPVVVAEPTPVRRRRLPPRPARAAQTLPVALAGARQHRYEVRFAVETVIPATDMRAVLRRLESLGARDIRSIVVTETS